MDFKPLITLLAIVNPLAIVPFFIHYTQGFNRNLSTAEIIGQLEACKVIGRFGIGASATQIQQILEIQEDGTTFDDLRFNGNPEWRGSAFLNWNLGGWSSGWSVRYVSEVEDSSATLDTDTSIRWQVDDWYTINGYVAYEFEPGPGLAGGTELKLGVRNLTDELPPYADETYGFITGLYSSEGRVVYGEISKTF